MFRIGIISALVCGLVSFGGSASAHDYKDKANVTIHYADGKFTGSVKDSTDFCEENTKVTLRKRGPDGSVKIAWGWTVDGFWRITHEKTPGPYYVVTKRKEQHFNGHDHICRKAISKEIGKQTW